jgi:regulator of RNase E activity RraA
VTFCGQVFTAHYVPGGVVKGTVGDFLDDVGPGQVVVIDNGGRTYCTVWGDLMTIDASQRGIAGTVIDACVATFLASGSCDTQFSPRGVIW